MGRRDLIRTLAKNNGISDEEVSRFLKATLNDVLNGIVVPGEVDLLIEILQNELRCSESEE
jgi:hypothetical protein